MKENVQDKAQHQQGDVVTEEGRFKKGLPPQIAWPLFVVGLLVIGVGYSLWIVLASQSGGGVQVVENYYEKAIAWDELQKLTKQSEALGWVVELTYVQNAVSGEAGEIEIRFEDNEGEPVTGLTGTVKASRPQAIGVVSEVALTSASGRPGVYFHALPEAHAGLWDFEVAVERDSLRFLKMIRKELF